MYYTYYLVTLRCGKGFLDCDKAGGLPVVLTNRLPTYFQHTLAPYFLAEQYLPTTNDSEMPRDGWIGNK